MKKVILSVALASVTFAFAQKSEIRDAVSAVNGGNNTEALTKIKAADQILNGKLYLLKPDLREQYYYAKGMALLKSGKTAEGAEVLGQISDMAQSKIYEGKNANKDRVYFVGKENAEKYGAGLDLDEDSYQPSLLSKIGQELNPILQKASDEAQKAYNAKKYLDAANKFLEVNNLLKAVGRPDQTFEYYAAISYALGKDNAKAVQVYQHLIDTGYTGVSTSYTALNKKTNERQKFDKTTFELIKKSSDYSDFKVETTKSVEKELYETAASLLLNDEKYTEAIALINKGLKKFPGDPKLQDLKIAAYSRSGNDAELEKSIREALAKNPKDKMNWANLGVITSKDVNKLDEAEKAFKKSLEIDPNYKPALQGLAFNIYLNSNLDKKIVDQINGARVEGNNDLVNKLLAKRKTRFEKALPYLEKLHQLDQKDYDVARTLAQIYHSLRMPEKEAEIKAVLKKLTADN